MDGVILTSTRIALYAAAGLAIVAGRDDLDLSVQNKWDWFYSSITHLGGVEITQDVLDKTLQEAKERGYL